MQLTNDLAMRLTLIDRIAQKLKSMAGSIARGGT